MTVVTARNRRRQLAPIGLRNKCQRRPGCTLRTEKRCLDNVKIAYGVGVESLTAWKVAPYTV